MNGITNLLFSFKTQLNREKVEVICNFFKFRKKMDTQPRKKRRVSYEDKPNIGRQPGFGLFNANDISYGFGGSATINMKADGSAGEGASTKGKRAIETTLKYYEGNWEMLQCEPYLMGIFYQHMGFFFSGGMCLTVGDDIVIPTGNFKALIDDVIQPAVARALIWLMCYSYVVWADVKVDGKHIVFVPDPSQVDVEFIRDKTTGMNRTVVTWVQQTINPEVSRLHFFDQIPMGISIGWQCSMIDAVSPLIDRLNTLEIARALILDRAARPSIPVQEHHSGQGQRMIDSDVPITQRRDIREFMDEKDKTRIDAITLDRVMNRIDAAYGNSDAKTKTYKVPPWERISNGLNEPRESNMILIPTGLQVGPRDTHPPDLSHNQSISDIVASLNHIMGLPKDPAVEGPTHVQIMLQDALARIATDMMAVLYPGKKMGVQLMNRIKMDRDMSMDLVRQGAMSRETHATLHPPPPEPKEQKNKK